MENNTVNKRLGLLINELGHNKNSFSKEIGMTNNTTIGSLVNKESFKPSYDVLIKIANAFPDVNMDWLITGRGEMMPEKSIILLNIQKRVKKAIQNLNARMSLTEVAEMLAMKKDAIESAYVSDVPNIDVIVKLIQNEVISSGELLFGRAINEANAGYCQECTAKEAEIMKLQRELIECLKTNK